MIRIFCDMCGEEIHDYTGGNRVTRRIRRRLEDVSVYVVVGVRQVGGVAPVWNSGHVCTACVVKVVTQGGDVA
jgi:hypothetical protein